MSLQDASVSGGGGRGEREREEEEETMDTQTANRMHAKNKMLNYGTV